MFSVAEHLERQSVVVMESTIPAEMTIAEWRRARTNRQTRSSRARVAARRFRHLPAVVGA